MPTQPDPVADAAGASQAEASVPYRALISIDELTQALVNIAHQRLRDGQWSATEEVGLDIRNVLNRYAYGAPVAVASIKTAFDTLETRDKLRTHPYTDMCRIGRDGNMIDVINEMKARVSELQRRGISVYAIKQESDYGAETWYRLMTDQQADDAEGVPPSAPMSDEEAAALRDLGEAPEEEPAP